MSVKNSLEKQIEMLEIAQAKALEDGDMEKVERLSISIISLGNMINGMN